MPCRLAMLARIFRGRNFKVSEVIDSLRLFSTGKLFTEVKQGPGSDEKSQSSLTRPAILRIKNRRQLFNDDVANVYLFLPDRCTISMVEHVRGRPAAQHYRRKSFINIVLRHVPTNSRRKT